MDGYRLHIDVPLGEDLEKAKHLAFFAVEYLSQMQKTGIDMFQYRLSHDLDRGNKNYLDINENGHCSSKKNKVEF